MIQIKTSELNKVYKIEVDGEAWEMRSPGAGDELRLGQVQRRVAQIDKKIKDGTATDADYDLYDQLERTMYEMFENMFKDSTENNANVKEWVKNTPMAIITAAISSIKDQIVAGEDKKEAEVVDGTQSTTN